MHAEFTTDYYRIQKNESQMNYFCVKDLFEIIEINGNNYNEK